MGALGLYNADVAGVIALLQRVSEASVAVEGEIVARIGAGLLVLVGIERGDGPAEAARMADRLVGYRVFADREGRMNRSVAEVAGGLLLVPQFTLAADTGKGMRPSFTPAASPEEGRVQFATLVDELGRRHAETCAGSFGAHMRVALVNDGPVTFLLRVLPSGGG